MKYYMILLVIINMINIIKSEVFYAEEVNGHNISDNKTGYSFFRTFLLTDFYLCSERYYRVHYIGEENGNWSKEFTACQPVGNGKSIDGISISGGLEYGIRHELSIWKTNITKYNISEEDGYAGVINDEIDAVYIYGDEFYRAGQVNSDCSQENEVAKRLISVFFKKKDYNFFYENETYIDIEKETKIIVTVKLLKPYEINYKGKITYKSEFYLLVDNNFENTISTNLKKILNETINLDITLIENYIAKNFTKRSVICGDIMINFNWTHNKMELEVGSKINFFYHGYRGGFRINFYLDDEDSNLLSRIRKICLIIIQYSGKKIPNEIKKTLTSGPIGYKDFEDVINSLGSFSIVAEQIIFYDILTSLVKENFPK